MSQAAEQIARQFANANVNKVTYGTILINVKVYGAVGDGVTDDTAAIQSAATAALSQTTVLFEGTPSAYTGSAPVLYFPAGHYVISDQINIGAYMTIRSDGYAIIEQTTDDTNIFNIPGGYLIHIEGIKFFYGKYAVYFDNSNIDAATLTLRDCEFQMSSDYAIYTWGTVGDNHLSTNLTIQKCRFIKPRKVLHNVCDNALVQDSWISIGKANFDANSAVFKNLKGLLRFDNMFGVPDMGTTGVDRLSRVRWVDNYEGFYALNSRFGGEFGGMPPVYNYAGYSSSYPYMGGQVVIQNSRVSPGPSAEVDSSVVNLRTGVPQLVVMTGNTYLAEAPYLKVEAGTVDFNTVFIGIADLQNRFKYQFEPNLTFSPGSIPADLMPFVISGKPSAFPVGPQSATILSGNKGKISFSIPPLVKTFTAIVTVSTNPNSAASGAYRTTASHVISFTTGHNGSAITDYLLNSSLHAPATPGVTVPALSTLHFGTGDTGTSTRAAASGGSFTVVWDNCTAPAEVTIEIVHSSMGA